jgi:hypothetical protein
MFPGMMPKIIASWSEWFSFQRQFSHVKRRLTEHGLHLVIIGSHKAGVTKMRPAITVYPEMLSDADLQELAKAAV